MKKRPRIKKSNLCSILKKAEQKTLFRVITEKGDVVYKFKSEIVKSDKIQS